ncbi:hypothetical protein L7F22_002477 [Adiantum nelumboides]|nr:hypothetical protein [Adiantum nelumboides]
MGRAPPGALLCSWHCSLAQRTWNRDGRGKVGSSRGLPTLGDEGCMSWCAPWHEASQHGLRQEVEVVATQRRLKPQAWGGGDSRWERQQGGEVKEGVNYFQAFNKAQSRVDTNLIAQSLLDKVMRDVFGTPPSTDDDVRERNVVKNVSHQVRVENENLYLHDVEDEFSVSVNESNNGDDDALDNEDPTKYDALLNMMATLSLDMKRMVGISTNGDAFMIGSSVKHTKFQKVLDEMDLDILKVEWLARDRVMERLSKLIPVILSY